MRRRFWNARLVVSAMLTPLLVGGIAYTGRAQTPDKAQTPLLNSWLTRYSGQYARVVETKGGKPVATWPSEGLPHMGGGQSLPAYSDVQQIGISGDYVYVNGTGLASHQMGPWYDGINRIFGNWPTNLNYIRRFPLHPKVATVKVTNGLGPLGLWVNGVALFNQLDGFSYNSLTHSEPQGPSQPGQQNTGNAIWTRNAVVVEQPTFDKSNAHQPQNGEYHYHANPVALRYQLGDNIALDKTTGDYREDTSKLHHSPILGWSHDGYPIYGPYAYADPQKPASGIRRMVSGFVVRDGSHHTADLRKTGRHALAKWASDLHKTTMTLAETQYGPDVSPRYQLGRYCEDFEFLGDLGETQGKNFDLDVYNGRFCVTPEFPNGTYAYFVTITSEGTPAYPYVIGRQWYGAPNGGDVRQLTETVTMITDAGPGEAVESRAENAAGGRQVTWNSVEGGHYRVEGSADGLQWKTAREDVTSHGLTTHCSLTAGEEAAYRKYRVRLVKLEPYDSLGNRGGMGGAGGPPPGRNGGPRP